MKLLILNFFDFQTSYTDGFGMFSPYHFLWLGIGLIFCIYICRIYRQMSPSNRQFLRKLIAGSGLFLQLLRAVLLMNAGAYDIGRLPLHLCAMAIYFEFIHAFFMKKTDTLFGQFLYAFCMPGALCALLFPDWTNYPWLHFITVSGFESHILLVTYVVMLIYGDNLQRDARKLPQCSLIMLALAAPVYVFDRLTDTNYMFLNVPSPGSPLEWFAFLGTPGYLLGYIPLIAVVWLILYAIPSKISKSSKK